MAEARAQFRFRDVAWYAPLAIIGGGLIATFMGRAWNIRIFLHGALIGLTCFAAVIAAEYWLHDWMEQRPEQWWRRAGVYFVVTQIAWPIGMVLGTLIVWQAPFSAVHLPRAAWISFVLVGGIGTLVGITTHGYEALKDRVRDSVEQLKELEFQEKELALARAFQSRMLPAAEIAADGYRITSRNFAARYVAGDFYDVFSHADGAIGIAIADVAGKGLAASLIMASVKSVLSMLAGSRSVNDAIAALNEKLVGELSKREFVALALARYEPQTGRVTLSNAGVPDPYLFRADGSVAPVSVTGMRLPLGLRRGVKYDQVAVELNRGDALLFFSDGLPEASKADGDPLGYEALASIVQSAGPDVDRILEAVQKVTIDAREDDQTIVLLQRA